MHHNTLDNNTLYEMLKMTANENKKGLGGLRQLNNEISKPFTQKDKHLYP